LFADLQVIPYLGFIERIQAHDDIRLNDLRLKRGNARQEEMRAIIGADDIGYFRRWR
jgi:hypothetical protein